MADGPIEGTPSGALGPKALIELARQVPGLAAGFEPEAEPEQGAVRDEQALPGEPADEEIRLDAGQEQEVIAEVMTILDLYDAAQAGRNEREHEVELYYALADEPTHGGTTSDAEHIASELLMSQVDQATSRIVENVMSTDPLMQVDPIIREGDKETVEHAKSLAESTERFLNSFAMNDMQLDRKLPIAIHRTVKVGTTVLHPKWVRRKVLEKWWGDDGKQALKEDEQGGIDVEIPANRHVIVWPPDRANWQDALFVGHRSFLSTGEWREYAFGVLDLSVEEALKVETGSQTNEDNRRQSRPELTDAYFGIKKDESLEDETGHIQITQLYAFMVLPGETEPRRLHLILHEPKRLLLYIDENRHHMQRIPYFPLRYKIVDDMAWGFGLGDEVVYCQAADAAMRNLQLDNLMSGAYHVVQVKAGTMADVLMDRPLPGQMVATDSPGEDMVVTPMGGKAEGLEEAVQDNRFRASAATGLAPVLGGQGDPTMKSGAGTGSTMALIEQAGKKFGHVDRTIREDFDQFANFILELVTQYAVDGLFYQFVSKEDARVVELLKYEPMRGVVHENLRVKVQAPNASTSREGRKAGYLTTWQFINQHFQLVFQMGDPILGAENAAGWEEYKGEVVRFMDEMAHQIVEYQDLPGLASLMPKMPEMTPQHEVINQLQQQLQQMEMQMQQMQEQAAQAEAAMGGGMPPEGMPPEAGGMPPGGPPMPPGPEGMPV